MFGYAPLRANFDSHDNIRGWDTKKSQNTQSAHLDREDETSLPTIYARDGSLVKYLTSDTIPMVKIQGLTNFEGVWDIPKRYVTPIGDTTTFGHVVVVDVTNQNICTLEKNDKGWVIRST